MVDSQEVKRGDMLVVIDGTDAKLALRQAQADLARAQAQVISATADLDRTKIDLQRRQALIASGSVSGDELTHVKNARKRRARSLECGPRRCGACPGARGQGRGGLSAARSSAPRSTGSSPGARCSSVSACSRPRPCSRSSR